MSERDEIDYDAWDDRRAKRAQACQCGGDMPGRCPGPANCPMCQNEDETEDEE